ncbi:hypothetical protein VaNZ11_000366 [Volvox africanus]|uniref:Peptidase M16 C-terminal domain-containing protein n=1 Tax=Volvox africanus TaxID=51714 RepID=A0ABQ5RMH0_9CHLO|nr:hypothetical protein VaNZ11_000366 [Volvox africanus]
MPNGACCSRPALLSGLWPTHQGQPQLLLIRTLSSNRFTHLCYPCSFHAARQLKVTHGQEASTRCAATVPRFPRRQTSCYGCGDSTSARVTQHRFPRHLQRLQPQPTSLFAPLTRPSHPIPSLLDAAARCAIALMLSAGVVLTATLGPLVNGANAGVVMMAEPPLSTAAAAAALGSLQQQMAPVPAAESSAGAASGALTSNTPLAGPGAPTIRFTSPDILDKLPPFPTEFPPLPELKLPQYTTAKLRNGLRVFLLRDDEVPLVRATLLMRGGQYGSPPDKVGVASLTAYVQRAGGSEAHPASSLDSRLEELAASIEFGAGPQALSADLQCLAEDAEEVMGLMAELVRTPVMPADKLLLYKAQVLNALEHQNDSPAAIGRRKITKLLYGAESIYARTPTQEGLSSISPEDLRSYISRWERPDGAVLGVVGAFEPRKMLALVEREFGDWAPASGQPDKPPVVPRGQPPAVPTLPGSATTAGSQMTATVTTAMPAAKPEPSPFRPVGNAITAAMESPATTVPSFNPVTDPAALTTSASSSRRPTVYLVDRPGLTQAYVLTAEPGITLSDPDLFSLDVLSGVFNSFGGQLFDKLRSREGLAYSVSGGWDSPPDHPGLFVAGGQTSSPGEFLRSLRQLLARAAAAAPSVQELEAAKAETLNSFAFNFSSTSNQLQRILVYDLLGLPQNFLFQYVQGIERVEQRDVAKAAAAHLHPERQVVVVVGDREVTQPSLEAVGFEVYPLRLDD